MPTTQTKPPVFGHQQPLWMLADDIIALEDAIFEIEDDDALIDAIKEQKIQQLFDRWIESEQDFKVKAAKVGAYVKYLDALTEARQNEYRRLRELAQKSEKQSKRLRGYLVASMERTGITKVEGATVNLSLRKKPPTVCLAVDPEALPPEFQKVTVEAKLSAIKEHLKANPECDFAFMSTTESFTVVIK